jgi:predicted enzyme related to lactoylglutathione lyase
VCHARGTNAQLPPQWLIYIRVRNLNESIERCLKEGGRVIDGPRGMGEQRFCVIQDPAGAYAALVGA